MKTLLDQVSPRGAVAAILVLSVSVTCGCGGSVSKGNTITGKVTYKDQPLTGGSITLHSTDGKSEYHAAIAPDGAFAIGGVSTGEMVVTIETESIRGKTGVSYQAPPGERAPEMGVKLEKYVPIPVAYGNQKSPLRVTVKKGSNKVEFNLNESGQ